MYVYANREGLLIFQERGLRGGPRWPKFIAHHKDENILRAAVEGAGVSQYILRSNGKETRGIAISWVNTEKDDDKAAEIIGRFAARVAMILDGT